MKQFNSNAVRNEVMTMQANQFNKALATPRKADKGTYYFIGFMLAAAALITALYSLGLVPLY